MYCKRATDAFIKADQMPKRKSVSDLTDSEIRNKVCEGKRGKRGNCAKCEIIDFCLIGQEKIRRGLDTK